MPEVITYFRYGIDIVTPWVTALNINSDSKVVCTEEYRNLEQDLPR